MKKDKSVNKRKRKFKINWLKLLFILFSIAFIIGGGIAAYFAYNIYHDTEEFDVNRLYADESSVIMAGDEVIYQYGSDENGKRDNVTYDQLPEVLIDAVVAAEDSRFFEHDGFDLPGISRALIENVMTAFQGGGGSTITQQLIKKSYFPEAERTITRKVSELFLAIEATNEVSKEEILTLYLNKIYFGRGMSTIGVSAASNYYFNKSVEQLTLPEAALLAGTLNSPSSYDPYYNLELATQRRDVVLQLMFEHGYISQAELDAALSVKVENMLDDSYSSNVSIANMAYIDIVNQEVIDKTGLDPRETQMTIHTFLDQDMQLEVVELTNNKYDFPTEDVQVGGSIQSTQDGRIVAVIGGRNYSGFNLNRAAIKQQPGSSLKPIIDYGAAYEFLDWSTAHTVEDKEYNIAGYNPANWNGTIGKYGKMTIANALENSWNTPAVWTFDSVYKEIGEQGYHDFLSGFGLDMTNETVNIAYSIGGWNEGLSPIQLANMYSTIANGGMAIEAHTIDYIEVAGQEEPIKIDEEIQNNANRAISPETAFMIRDSMNQYMSGGQYSRFNFAGIKAKTGTTNWGENSFGITEGMAKDSWFAAYNPDYSVATWLGYDYETLLSNPRHINGFMSEARLYCYDILKEIIPRDVTNSYPPTPSTLTQGSIVKGVYPYVLPTEGVPKEMIHTGWFKPGTYPSTSLSDLSINPLEKFDVVMNNEGSFNVSIAPYNPIEATTKEDFDTATSIYGTVEYVVEIVDAKTNEVLHTTNTLETEFTINYKPKSSVLVNGYYRYKNSDTIKSNVITKKFTIEPTISPISYTISLGGTKLTNGQTIEAGTVNVLVSSQTLTSVVEISLLDSAGQVVIAPTKGNSATFNLEKGKYTIIINETVDSQKAKTVSFVLNVTNDEDNQTTTPQE